MFKAVIFDYNGVLVNDLKIHEEVYVRVAQEMGFFLTREKIRQHISTSPNEKRELYFGNISDETWNRIFELKTKYYFELAREQDLLFPEAKEILPVLAQDYLLGLISNTPRGYFERIFPPHLAGLFRETIFGDEVPRPKPSPDGLLKMMGRLGLCTDECCYVGDAISDILMAKPLGVRIFAVTTGDNSRQELQEAGADWVLEGLSELQEKLRGLEEAD